jgi:hypothetical protein
MLDIPISAKYGNSGDPQTFRILRLSDEAMAEVNLAHAEVGSRRATHDQASAEETYASFRIPSSNVMEVPIASLRPGESPRLEGEDKAHVAWLMETQASLPPILVDRRTMQVIDGMHRLQAASLKGRASIQVQFFDGSPADAFLRGVEICWMPSGVTGLICSSSPRRLSMAKNLCGRTLPGLI